MEKRLEKRRKLDAGISSPHGVDEMENNKLKRKISVLEQELQEARAARISKLESSLKVAKRQADAYKFQLKSSREKHRNATDELQAVEKAFIEGFENYFPGNARREHDTVHEKRMGILDTTEDWFEALWDAFTGDEIRDAKITEFLRYWEARVREPDFDASICEDDREGNLKYTIKGDHGELNQVLENFGLEVYEAVCNAHLQVKEHGAGTTVLWLYGENRKATLLDVLERWSIRLEPKQ